MTEEIRLVDLFESVMERPYLYTLSGSYVEAVAYLEGCRNALGHILENTEFNHSSYVIGIKRYCEYQRWLSERTGLTGSKIMEIFMENQENACKLALESYKSFKKSLEES